MMMKELEHLSYEESLRELLLCNLEKACGDLIKILQREKGSILWREGLWKDLFSGVHCLLFCYWTPTDTQDVLSEYNRKHFSVVRVAEQWQKLIREVVESPNLKISMQSFLNKFFGLLMKCVHSTTVAPLSFVSKKKKKKRKSLIDPFFQKNRWKVPTGDYCITEHKFQSLEPDSSLVGCLCNVPIWFVWSWLPLVMSTIFSYQMAFWNKCSMLFVLIELHNDYCHINSQ